MADVCKILASTFQPERGHGLTWVETTDWVMTSEGEAGDEYKVWLLVEDRTDRVITTIDGPTRLQLCYDVAAEARTPRKFISIDGAKRYALSLALEILESEGAQRSLSRKIRTIERKAASR